MRRFEPAFAGERRRRRRAQRQARPRVRPFTLTSKPLTWARSATSSVPGAAMAGPSVIRTSCSRIAAVGPPGHLGGDLKRNKAGHARLRTAHEEARPHAHWPLQRRRLSRQAHRAAAWPDHKPRVRHAQRALKMVLRNRPDALTGQAAGRRAARSPSMSRCGVGNAAAPPSRAPDGRRVVCWTDEAGVRVGGAAALAAELDLQIEVEQRHQTRRTR